MRAYVAYTSKKFSYNLVYRFDFLMGILNTCIQFFIFWCIYRSLYGSETQVNGVDFSKVATHFILSLGLSNAFAIDDLFMQRKVADGSIVNEFLRPISFKLRMLAEDAGNIAFRLVFNFLPALIIAMFLTEIQSPASLGSALLFAISVLLGFLILWEISFIVQTTSFWIINVWSVSTIKNVLVNVLSGIFLPIWFMPAFILDWMRYLPFESIYFTPLRFYLGEIPADDVLIQFGKQLLWIAILFVIGEVLWRRGQKKLIVYGG